MLNRMLTYQQGFFRLWEKDLTEDYGIKLQDKTIKNVVNVMTNEFPLDPAERHMRTVFLWRKQDAESMS